MTRFFGRRLREGTAVLVATFLAGCIPKKPVETPTAGPLPVVVLPPVAKAPEKSEPTAPVVNANGARAPVASSTKGRERKSTGKKYDRAPESHREALLRQIEGGFERRTDKDGQVRIPLADAKHWKRVRFFGVEHLTGFRYGEDHHAVTGAFVVKTPPGEKPTSRSCLARFEEEGFAKFRRHKGKLGQLFEREGRWKRQSVVAHQADGKLTVFFSHYEFSAAWVAYPAYEDGCLVVASILLWDDEAELAQKARDRWVEEAVPLVQMKTKVVPYRH